MSNTILTPTAVTREALRILHNNLVFTKGVDRQYDDQYARKGAKIGDTLKVRLPNKFLIREGVTLNTQDVNETSTDLQMSTRRGVDINFTSAELTLDLDHFSRRILKPAMSRLASEIDRLGLLEYTNINSQVGTPGTTPTTARVALQAGQKLSEFCTPDDNQRYMCVNPAANASMVDGLKALFHSGKDVASQYKKGNMGGGVLNFDWGMTQNIAVHTTGAFAGTVLIDDASIASGDTTIGMDAFTDSAPTIKNGDVFTIAGVNAANPETGVDTGSLMQFHVTADLTGASNELTAAFLPAITTSGIDKTVTALPVDGAAVTWAGTASTAYPVNMAHHKEAFALVTADLELPKGVDFAARTRHEGIAMRIVRNYDIINDKFPCRIDVHFGWKTLRREFACRMIG